MYGLFFFLLISRLNKEIKGNKTNRYCVRVKVVSTVIIGSEHLVQLFDVLVLI